MIRWIIHSNSKRFIHIKKCVNCNLDTIGYNTNNNYIKDLIECTNCHSKQPLPDTLNYFHLLTGDSSTSTPGDLNINLNNLKEAYLSVMKICHPDRARTACDKVTGEAWSAWASKAYSCLRNPFSRAKHLVRISCPHDEDRPGGLSESELFDILSKRETLEASNSPNEIQLILKENDAIIGHEYNILNAAIGRHDCSTAIHVINRLNYWNNLKEAGEERLQHLSK